MVKNNKKVIVALSGGVDSSVAAFLLKEQGFDVVGVHIKMWSDPSIPCSTKEDRYYAMRVAAEIGIPFETWDFTEEYKSRVVDYMINEYSVGRTPNPDVMCNRKIKFGAFFQKAISCGADFVATGHYVRIRNQESETKLLQAEDKNKDQSYFLWTLTQQELSKCLFPIGDYTKPEVRRMAEKALLPTAKKKDSQGICFIGKLDMREFLKKYIPEKRGLVVTTGGKKVGEHNGLEFYTLGQRRGIAIGGGRPYYVAEKDFSTNTLVVASNDSDTGLYRGSLYAVDMNWISGKVPKMPFGCEARIRYRQPLQKAVIESRMENKELKAEDSLIHNSELLIRFNAPQRAVTPGQSVVLYKGDEMLGGGIIE